MYNADKISAAYKEELSIYSTQNPYYAFRDQLSNFLTDIFFIAQRPEIHYKGLDYPEWLHYEVSNYLLQEETSNYSRKENSNIITIDYSEDNSVECIYYKGVNALVTKNKINDFKEYIDNTLIVPEEVELFNVNKIISEYLSLMVAIETIINKLERIFTKIEFQNAIGDMSYNNKITNYMLMLLEKKRILKPLRKNDSNEVIDYIVVV